ncbi:heterokaryon incompatibility protein-domain-containing protein [Xylaria telfairii]|nr:heterokaryon incompatibility protein-domain-containing protein [Xylaria telfairii]
MWLINVETYTLENITNPRKGSYAILSHTWEDGEVSFQQYHNIEDAKKLKGFKKIDMTIQLARGKNLEYAWVDTCCIDKSSSAELSEAINSMFQWYSDAACCFVCLSDLSSAEITPSISLANQSRWPKSGTSKGLNQLLEVQQPTALAFKSCRWFFRGWTLQELIAPKFVEFYDNEWTLIGTKDTLIDLISWVTGIPTAVLSMNVPLRKIPIAQRMSWAADRCTTRIEDIAYCLLGLFDINMGPLYGEGKKSFIRLQEEILKQSDDITLFAWEADQYDDQQYRGILASSPSEFRDSGTIRRDDISRNEVGEFRMTNKGLCLDGSNLTHLSHNSAVLSLNCKRPGGGGDSNIGIRLMTTQHGCVRFLPRQLVEFLQFPELTSVVETPIFIARTVHLDDSAEIARETIGLAISYEEETKLLVWPHTFYNPIEQKGFLPNKKLVQAFIIECLEPSGQQEKFMIVFKFGTDSWLCIRRLGGFAHRGCRSKHTRDEEYEHLVKTNSIKRPNLYRTDPDFDFGNHPSCVIGTQCGMNRTEEVMLPGARFYCAIKMFAGSASLAIKITAAVTIDVTRIG